MNEERVAIERDACLAPSGEEWKLMLRREETLDRSIDRKIKLLLSLRKNVGAPLVGARADDEGGHKGRPYGEPDASRTGTPACAGEGIAGSRETGKRACPTPKKIDERTGNVDENKGQSWNTAGTGRQEAGETATGPGDKVTS